MAACTDQTISPVAPEAVAGSEDALAPLHRSDGTAVPGSYIVVLKSGASPSSVTSAAGIRPQLTYSAGPGEARSTSDAQPSPDAVPLLNGFAATLGPNELQALRADPNVAYVEEDQVLTAHGTQYMSGDYGDPWGLDRIDQRSSSLSESYTYGDDGAGVYVYMIDSGLQASHPEFEGRAKNVYDAFGGSGSDCDGHGTKVAGIVGGKTWGVAKKAYLRGVRVLDCNGSGTTSKLIAAMDWVRKNRGNPAVANVSLGGSYSSAVNDAVQQLVSSGVFVSVSAGNNGTDACKYSPASASSVFTTAASTKTDYKVSYSNYGKCIDAYAPGYNLMTSSLGSSKTRVSGTSMAAPHIAGVAALYKGKYGNASSSTIDSWLKGNATTSVIRSNPSGTPNRLLFSGLTSTSTSTAWQSRDIGSVAAAGSFAIGSGVFTLKGSGSDIQNRADELHFAYQRLSGDGEIRARITSQTRTSSWAKAGVMIRESLSSGSKNATVLLTPSYGVRMQRRSSSGGSTTAWSGGSGAAPVWLRLVRSGSTLSGYRSSDGSSWSKIGSVSISMAKDIYVGLVVTSHDDGDLSTAKFEGVSVVL